MHDTRSDKLCFPFPLPFVSLLPRIWKNCVFLHWGSLSKAIGKEPLLNRLSSLSGLNVNYVITSIACAWHPSVPFSWYETSLGTGEMDQKGSLWTPFAPCLHWLWKRDIFRTETHQLAQCHVSGREHLKLQKLQIKAEVPTSTIIMTIFVITGCKTCLCNKQTAMQIRSHPAMVWSRSPADMNPSVISWKCLNHAKGGLPRKLAQESTGIQVHSWGPSLS